MNSPQEQRHTTAKRPPPRSRLRDAPHLRQLLAAETWPTGASAPGQSNTRRLPLAPSEGTGSIQAVSRKATPTGARYGASLERRSPRTVVRAAAEPRTSRASAALRGMPPPDTDGAPTSTDWVAAARALATLSYNVANRQPTMAHPSTAQLDGPNGASAGAVRGADAAVVGSAVAGAPEPAGTLTARPRYRPRQAERGFLHALATPARSPRSSDAVKGLTRPLRRSRACPSRPPHGPCLQGTPSAPTVAR